MQQDSPQQGTQQQLEQSQKSAPTRRVLLIMKLAAVFLMVLIFGLIFYNSRQQIVEIRDSVRTNIPDAGPKAARPLALKSPLPVVGPDKKIHLMHTTDWKGKVVHIVFWAQWCQPCRIELPLLEKEQRRRRKDYQAILIDEDDDNAGRIAAAHLAAKIAPSIPLGFDRDRSLNTAYNIQALPFHVLIDRNGHEAAMFTSTIYGEPQFDRLLDELIAEPISSAENK